MRPLSADVLAAYLSRLGLDAEPPSAQALRRLHRRHAERIPYESLWIQAGERWDTDPYQAATRIAFEGRGGYCYQVNGALAALLASLGYRVGQHCGVVHGPDGPVAADLGNHLVLSVAGLPTDQNPGGEWYVDVGLGDALHEPMALVEGPVRQGPFRFELARSDFGGGGWHLTHDPSGSFTGMAWLAAPADPDLLLAKHAWLSTAPESPFARVGTVQTRDAAGADVLRGLVVTRIGTDACTEEPLTDRESYFEVLADRFGLTFPTADPETLDRLWERTLAAHRAWEAERASQDRLLAREK